MMNKELEKDEIIKILSEYEVVGKGTDGILFKYDENTLLKIYYKDIFDAYMDISKLDIVIKSNLEIEEEMKNINNKYRTHLETAISNINQLQSTKSNSLIKGVATYKSYLIGSFIEYYREHELLYEIFPSLNNGEQRIIFDTLEDLIEDLYEHGVCPTDLKEDNIMVRKSDLDVKIIDLDGKETRYENTEYLKKFPHIKTNVIKSFMDMKKRLEKSIEIEDEER